PPGFADRVAHAARSLDGLRWPLYGSLTLAEPSACWSSSWRRVFEALSRAGTSLSQLSADLPGAPPATDLGKVPATLRDVQAAAVTLRGDGSLVLLTAPTAIEAAAGTAAWVDATSEGECVVIREDDAATLENAFATRGMPSQGSSAVSPW